MWPRAPWRPSHTDPALRLCERTGGEGGAAVAHPPRRVTQGQGRSTKPKSQSGSERQTSVCLIYRSPTPHERENSQSPIWICTAGLARNTPRLRPPLRGHIHDIRGPLSTGGDDGFGVIREGIISLGSRHQSQKPFGKPNACLRVKT